MLARDVELRDGALRRRHLELVRPPVFAPRPRLTRNPWRLGAGLAMLALVSAPVIYGALWLFA